MSNIIRLALLSILMWMLIACVQGDAMANADVWLDVDADGIKDPEDPPIEGVCVWATTAPDTYNEFDVRNYCRYSDPNRETHTDATGHVPGKKATGGQLFFAGASCRYIYVYVEVPEGYKLSTPGKVNDCHASFGLVRTTP